MNALRIIFDGIIKRNPTFVLILGMCPTLGTTSSAVTGMSMGLATLFVLMCSNMAISAIKRIVPDKVRIPVYIVVIASFVTILQMLMQAYAPALYASLGIFIPLIVVNCILLGRAEAFASKNTVFASLCDGLGVLVCFSLAFTLLCALRELLRFHSCLDIAWCRTRTARHRRRIWPATLQRRFRCSSFCARSGCIYRFGSVDSSF